MTIWPETAIHFPKVLKNRRSNYVDQLNYFKILTDKCLILSLLIISSNSCPLKYFVLEGNI